MKKHPLRLGWAVLVLLALTAAACAPQARSAELASITPEATQTLPQQAFTDPFSYCAAVGTVDSPDSRYTGPKITEEIINGFKKAAGLEASTEPMEMFKQTTIWRCMDAKVYACNFGANLPCSSKANTDKTPSPAMVDYCKANQDSDFIPMSVTGHSTIYSWHCVKDAPELLNQIETVDPAGFLEGIWYAIEPNVPGSTPPGEPPAAAGDSMPAETPIPTQTPVGGSGQILFASNRGDSYDDLYLLELANSQVSRLTQGNSNTFPGPFSPDGSQIVFTGFGLTHSFIGVMAADGSSPVNLTQAVDADEGFPAWSPDGKLIAFTSRRDGNNEIYVMNADGSDPRRLTINPKDDFAPAWSPDGRLIAFVSDRDNETGVYSLYLMNSDGSAVKRLTTTGGSDYTPSWSPDGTQIAFRLTGKGSADIAVIDADGNGLKRLTNGSGENWAPVWSPDGRQIAFQSNRDGNWEIYSMHADGTAPQNLTNNPADDQMPYWGK